MKDETSVKTTSPKSVAAASPRLLGRLAVGASIVILVAAFVTAAMSLSAVFSKREQANQKQAGKVYRIGILNGLDFFGSITDGFKEKMTELGYVEGKNVIYDEYKAAAPVGNQVILEKFIKERVDLILVYPTEASLEAKAAATGTGIPVISGTALIEGNDLVDNVSQPGGNITGVNFGGTGVAVKRFEVIHEIVPSAKTFFVPYLKDYPTVAPIMNALKSAAEPMGITLEDAPFATPDELKTYLQNWPKDKKVDAVLQIVEPLSAMPDSNEAVWRWAEVRGVPVSGATVIDDAYGPIIGYEPDTTDMGEMSAVLAAKVFSGIKAGTIPMPTAQGFLDVNLKVAARLGLTVDNDLLGQARKIIR